MQDDGAFEAFERPCRRLVRRPRMDDHRLPEPARDFQLLLEEAKLRVARRVVAEEVEARLADGDCAVVAEQLGELGDASRLVACGLVGMDAEHRVDPLVLLGQRERRPARVDPGADRNDPRDACLARPAMARLGEG